MLEKIIDKYYAKKLVQKLIDAISVYYIDKNVIYTKHMVELYVKKKKWKEENYVLIMAKPYSECFDVLVNGYMELEKTVRESIKKLKE